MTWLPSTVTGRFFYLYLVEDLYSRYGVVWEVHERESGELAAELLEKAVWREKLYGKDKPVLHNDNGSIMKAQTFRAKLDELGLNQSFSRPRVSDDNAYVESFFRTLKYAPTWPAKALPRWRKPVSGCSSSCSGTTTDTSTAKSALSPQHNATTGRTRPSLPSGWKSMPLPKPNTLNAGRAIPGTGLPLLPSPSTPTNQCGKK
ncbi:transposase family protein (plasmid) [Thiothrix fructosivorans]|uniref:Transposase family protein n=1 Tax=Thiothrix fructosivorans TaxID=111770 RepID=A0ABS3IG60_9GAMM|nr:transposase family protein [Thiothrix fructosivorans]